MSQITYSNVEKYVYDKNFLHSIEENIQRKAWQNI